MADVFKLCSQRLHDRLDNLKASYVKFVSKNPATVNQIEKTVKATSYLFEALSRNYETSIFITEFIASACNLFAFANAQIFLKSKKLLSKAADNKLVEKTKQLLAVVEFSQAFLEISAWKIGGSGARWAVIVIICLVKSVLRCLLLFLFNTGIQSHSLANLMKTSNFISSNFNIVDHSTEADEPNVVYIGSRTGHKMRTLDGSSSSTDFSVPHSIGGGPSLNLHLPPTPLTATEKIGECLHAVRPLVHVVATGLCRSQSFLPWFTALVIDSSSSVLLQRKPQSPTCTQAPYNHTERSELRRRYMNLFLYLLRSPFYDKVTERWLLRMLEVLSENVPLARFVLSPLSQYIPEWQRVYFYTWTD